jgi:hypothetical protein
VPDVRCVGRLPPVILLLNYHRPVHPFSSTPFLSHPHLSFTMVLLVAPQRPVKLLLLGAWAMPLSFAKLLERRSGARVVRELPYAIAPRGQEHVGGANCYSRWPRAQLGSESSPVWLLPAVGCRPSLSVAPRGHRRRAPPAPQCPVGANHCAHVAFVFLTCCKCSVRMFQN